MRFLRRTAAVLAVASFAGGVLGAFPGIASATQANQAWAGTNAGNGYWNYLGNPSGGDAFDGPIHNFNAGSGMCLDVPGPRFFLTGYYAYGDPSGAQVQLWSCNGGANQQWQQQDNGDGSWSYYVVDGDNQYYCLDSLEGHDFDSSPVELYPCNGDSAQKWTIGPGGELQSVGSPGFCADATNWGTGDGTQIQLWQCT